MFVENQGKYGPQSGKPSFHKLVTQNRNQDSQKVFVEVQEFGKGKSKHYLHSDELGVNITNLPKSVPVRQKNTGWKHPVPRLPSVGPLWETDEVKRTCSWLFDGLKDLFTSGKVLR